MLEVSQRLGDFEVVRLLGKGGMGEVYEALQLNPPRPVALKVLKPWLAQDDEALQRFWREAAVPARLDHPGIVRIIATGKTEDGIAYYAMQLVRGLTLAQLVQKAAEAAQARTVPHSYPVEPVTPAENAPGHDLFLTPNPATGEESAPAVLRQYQADRYSVVVRVGIQAARALASAHRQGVLHRDIKPSNLMIDHHDQLYVVDFGLTRALLPDGLSTRPGSVCGTPWYMSPEQARGEPVDGRSDLFSLGVTLYELAAGGAGPYTGDRHDNDAVLREVRAGHILPLGSVASGVPVELECIIHRLLRANPRRRYQTAEELSADLEKLNRQPELLSGTRRLRKTRHWIVYGGLGLLAVAAVALALTWIRPSGVPGVPPPPPPEAKKPTATDSWPTLPPERIEHKLNFPLPLIQTNYDPVWVAKIMGGKRPYTASPLLKLAVASPPREEVTLLALDNDPEKHWFELKVRMRVMATAPTANSAQGAGVFFGYRHDPADPNPGSNFFVVQLNEIAPQYHVPSKLLVGTAYLAEARGLRGHHLRWLSPFRGEKGSFLLPPPSTPEGWRWLRIRALDHKVTISVDDKDLVVLNLRGADEALLPEGGIDPRGALGIWANEGVGMFTEGTVAILKSQEIE